MGFILEVLLDGLIILIMAKALPAITIRNYGTAILVALVIALLNATIGALLRFPLNLLTFFLLGFFVRLFVTAVMIKLTDKFFAGFSVKGFGPALVLAFVLALVSGLFTTFWYGTAG